MENKSNPMKYVIFPDDEGHYRLTAINKNGEQFKQRKNLPVFIIIFLCAAKMFFIGKKFYWLRN